MSFKTSLPFFVVALTLWFVSAMLVVVGVKAHCTTELISVWLFVSAMLKLGQGAQCTTFAFVGVPSLWNIMSVPIDIAWTIVFGSTLFFKDHVKDCSDVTDVARGVIITEICIYGLIFLAACLVIGWMGFTWCLNRGSYHRL